MFCRHHRHAADCARYPERCDRHNDVLEHLMGDLTNLTTDVTALISENQSLKAENAQLKADADTNAANDQAAIDALDAQVKAELTPAPVTDPSAPVDGSTDPAAPADGSTPIADSIPTA